MRHFLKRLLVGVCIAVVMMLMHKVASAATYWTGGGNGVHYGTAGEACSVQTPTATFNNVTQEDGSMYRCHMTTSTGAAYSGVVAYLFGTCDAPTVPDAASGSCITPNTCPAVDQKYGDKSTAVYISGTGSHVCLGGCDMGGSFAYTPSGAGALTVIIGPFYSTHNQCDGSGAGGTAPNSQPAPPNQPSPAPTPCPTGTTYVGIDSSGIAMCSGTAHPPADPPPPVTTTAPQVANADGSKTDVTTQTKTNSDGSVTTTTTRTQTGTDGSKSTTTTTTTGSIPGTGGSGSVGGIPATPTTKGTEDNPNDLCKLHPDLNICKNSTVSGSCADTACNGDAITCSLLQLQRKTYCENTKDDANSTAGKLILAGNDPMKSLFPTPANGSTVQMPSSLSQSTFLGAACFPDKVVQVGHFAITLPYSQVCNYLIAFRYALMFTTLMMCFHMVTSTILRT